MEERKSEIELCIIDNANTDFLEQPSQSLNDISAINVGESLSFPETWIENVNRFSNRVIEIARFSAGFDFGPYDMEQWQEMLQEVNHRIRNLQMDKTALEKQYSEKLELISKTVETQKEMRIDHDLEIEALHTKIRKQRLHWMQQIEQIEQHRDKLIKKDEVQRSKIEQLEFKIDRNESVHSFAMQKKIENVRNEEQKSSENENLRFIDFWKSKALKLELQINRNEEQESSENEKLKLIDFWKTKALKSEAEFDDIRMKYERECKRRRILHNEIQELKGNIRIFVRCRPLVENEIELKAKNIVQASPDGETIRIWNKNGKKSKFKFDTVFSPRNTNEDVCEECAAYMESVIDGYNVTIIAYGQTNSGKTYTMSAVNKCAIENIFALQKLKKEFIFEIEVSFLEIYNETIIDLLVPCNEQENSYSIGFRTEKKREMCVRGLTTIEVNSVSDIFKVMNSGEKQRSVSHTKMNAHSSRSHSIFMIRITGVNQITGQTFIGKLNLIDLAGSERVKKSGVTGKSLNEAKNINKSLSALGNVIEALVDQSENKHKSRHIPFRDSKLTHILQDSLGHNAKTLMFVHISPADIHEVETMTTLRFAQRVKKVEFGKS